MAQAKLTESIETAVRHGWRVRMGEIEPSDMDSKRVFTLMLFLTTLTSSAGEGSGPVLTIPTG